MRRESRAEWDSILPRPAKVRTLGGLVGADALRLTCHDAPAPPPGVAEQWDAEAEDSYIHLFGTALTFFGESVPPLRRGGENNGSSDQELPLRILCDEALAPEAYTMSVRAGTEGGIEIRASDYEGVARAAATIASYGLLHSFDGTGRTVRLACAEITDAPRFGWRGAMLDLSRHLFPLSYLERFIDLLFLHKVRYLHLHLCDDQGWRIEMPGYPRLTEIGAYRSNEMRGDAYYGGFYSRKELSELDRYASTRGITLVPEVDMPGHASAAIAAYPKLSCSEASIDVPTGFGIFDNVLCAGKENTFAFVQDVVASLASTFAGPYIHLGGDETPTGPWSTCPSCSKRVQTEGLSGIEELHPYFMNRAARDVLEAGRTPIVWDEAISKRLPKEAIIMAWQGRRSVRESLDAGFKTIACPQDRACYLDHKHLDDEAEPGRLSVCTVRNSAEFEPAGEQPDPALLGLQANIWTEGIRYGRELEFMSFPRLSALMAGAWESEHLPFQANSARLAAHRDILLGFGVYAYPGRFE